MHHRILIGSSVSDRVLASTSRPSPAVARALLTAFAEQKVAVIDYRDGRGVRTQRTIEAQYLYYALPLWYLVAWDHLRADIRAFRIDRILDIKLTSERFRLRNSDQFLAAGELTAHPL